MVGGPRERLLTSFFTCVALSKCHSSLTQVSHGRVLVCQWDSSLDP